MERWWPKYSSGDFTTQGVSPHGMWITLAEFRGRALKVYFINWDAMADRDQSLRDGTSHSVLGLDCSRTVDVRWLAVAARSSPITASRMVPDSRASLDRSSAWNFWLSCFSHKMQG
ncbi:hypothetical protein CLAIMM_12948 [Cladophialophora immunda]|nr:hypothetical protein CLAIMM_12948 [Cladophialophora immunda]